ncbi:hypothetical protein AHAS_Ahas02G0168800 [Arachis hypogaea]
MTVHLLVHLLKDCTQKLTFLTSHGDKCTITLKDVAMQLGLPIDGEPVSTTLRS